MGVQDEFFLFEPSDYVNVTVRNDNGFWVVRQIVEIIEFLDLIRLIFKIEQIAVSLLDWEDRDFLDSAQQVGRLADRYASLVGLHCSCEILRGNRIAQNLRQLHKNSIVDPNRRTLGYRFEFIRSVGKLILQKFHLLLELLAQILANHLVERNVPEVAVRGKGLHLLLEVAQPIQILVKT